MLGIEDDDTITRGEAERLVLKRAGKRRDGRHTLHIADERGGVLCGNDYARFDAKLDSYPDESWFRFCKMCLRVRRSRRRYKRMHERSVEGYRL